MLGTPTLIAYRGHDGEWIVPTLGTNDRYGMCVPEVVRVVAVCQNQDGTFDAFQDESMTSDDGLRVLGPCRNAVDRGVEAPDPVIVGGTMEQVGRVFIGGFSVSSSTAPWTYQVSLPIPGAYDLIASDDYFDATGRIIIRRDQSLAGSTFLDTIDLDNGGTQLEEFPLAVDEPLADEMFSSVTTLDTEHGTADISEVRGLVAHRAPKAILQPTDAQRLALRGDAVLGNRMITRFAFLSVDDADTTLSLIPIGDVSYGSDDMSVTWDAIPADCTSVSMRLGGSGNSVTATISRTLIESTNARGITFDTSHPEYRTSWRVGPSDAFLLRTFTLEAELEDRTLRSTVSERF